MAHPKRRQSKALTAVGRRGAQAGLMRMPGHTAPMRGCRRKAMLWFDRSGSDSHLVLIDHELAAVVTALAAYMVVHMPCSAVGADGESGDQCLVVCAAFRCSCVRLSAFRMCHFSMYF